MGNVNVNVIERLYIGRCDITVTKNETDPQTGREVSVINPQQSFANVPCRLSYQINKAAGFENHAACTVQAVKLFLRADIDVPPGSVITVTQNGRTATYRNSGTSAIYENHQEIPIERAEKA